MKQQLLFTALLSIGLAGSLQAHQTRPVHLGLIYPLSTNGIQAAQITNTFSAHALVGLSASEQAFCASGIANIIRQDAVGATLAGFSNHIGGNALGMQAAGFINTVGGATQGMQAAGFMNISRSMDGAQLAGFANIASKSTKGVQAAGFINVAGDAQNQVAGFINIARRVEGVQIAGFINIAEHSDYPIGLVNIIKDGTRALGVTVDEDGTSLLALRSGGRVLYGILGGGINLRHEERSYALEAGLGAHLRMTRFFNINLEVAVTSLTDFERESYFKSSLRVLPALRLGSTLELFAGPSLSYSGYDDLHWHGFRDRFLWDSHRHGRFHGLSVGWLAGVQLHL
jgi:hypothetical protein